MRKKRNSVVVERRRWKIFASHNECVKAGVRAESIEALFCVRIVELGEVVRIPILEGLDNLKGDGEEREGEET